MATETQTRNKDAGVIVKDRDFKAMAGIRKAMELVPPGSVDRRSVIEWFRQTYDPAPPPPAKE